jgi:histidinol dehydrogenase
MRILDWAKLDEIARRAALARPCPTTDGSIAAVVQQVIDGVRARGDDAVREYTQRFDGVQLEALAVTPGEFRAARNVLTGAQTEALERAINNVQTFHAAQQPRPLALETEPGVRCEQLLRPLEAVGLYVPAGTAPLPSTVIMLAIPARIAGCPRRVLCTPPQRDGRAHPAVLTAAQLCGIDTVFKVGGAQAIAALAYGTHSIPKVDKIFGPGSAWVTTAKQLVAHDPAGAAFDLPAGPSEVLVIADAQAHADFVASDLLAQSEHDTLAQAILVSDSHALAQQVAAQIAVQRAALSRGSILALSLQACRCLVVANLDTAFEVSNAYAPEHLILQVQEPRRWLSRVRSAGAVFLGAWSPEPLGDYCAGSNHVLPTNGHARTLSGLSVRDFMKSIAVQELSQEGLAALGPTAVTLALLEGLDAHASAVTRRLTQLESAGTPSAAQASP